MHLNCFEPQMGKMKKHLKFFKCYKPLKEIDKFDNGHIGGIKCSRFLKYTYCLHAHCSYEIFKGWSLLANVLNIT